MNIKKKVFVGMSGGVDSSVSAYLLKKQGYRVVGVFIKVWQPDFLPCHWERERLDAMRVAALLEIPFLMCNAEEAYKKEVADYFIAEYKAGRTPNPDIMCNTHVKFGVFYQFARERGADFIATGHYARTRVVEGRPRLCRGADTEKDQSYFLWNISDDALAHTLFPIGDMVKSEVRAVAKKAKLPTATKDESQGICFLGHVDIPEFLSHYLPLRDGLVLTEEGGAVGAHHGAETFTIGQRHGFHMYPEHAHTEPYFVIAKDVASNTITVSHKKPETGRAGTRLVLERGYLHAIDTTPEVTLQTRYRQTPVRGRIATAFETHIEIDLRETADFPAEGQSCVLYQGDVVVGGGIIENILANA